MNAKALHRNWINRGTEVTGEKGQGRGKGENMDKGGKYLEKSRDIEISG